MNFFKVWLPYFFFSSLLLLSSSEAFAIVKVTEVSGASYYELPPENASNADNTTDKTSIPVIYGGTAGPDCDGDENDDGTCNNCDDVGGLNKCNPARINSAVRLRIEFKSDTTIGKPIITDEDGDALIYAAGNTTSGKDQVTYVEVTWGVICTAIDSDDNPTCEDDNDSAGKVFVGIDSNNDGTVDDSINVSIKVYTPSLNDDYDVNDGCEADSGANQGICDFIAFPGDEKIYITEPEQASGFPATGNITFDRVRAYVSSKGFICKPSDAENVADFTISGSSTEDYSIDNKEVGGLKNGTLYFVRLATVDKANNVGNFTSDSAIEEACGFSLSDCESLTEEDFADMAAENPSCTYIARPDEVLGLLSEDFNCFIASAALGTPLHPMLNTLRAFRSQILSRFAWGKAFIGFYYKKGPYAAKWVHDHPWSRYPLQILLWPAWLFAWISLNLGLSLALFLGFSLLALPVFFVFKRHHLFKQGKSLG